jgi:glycosyltransferase involved in cell wall biosynthesis
MKILHIIQSVNPAGGGPIEGIRQLSAVAVQAGHKVEIASLDAPGSPWLNDLPVPVHACGPGAFTYGFTTRFVPWLRKHAPMYDVVIVNGLWGYHSFATWRALKKSGTPYVVYTHGMLDPWFKHTYPLKHLKKWMYWPWADYRVLRDASAVLFTCAEERVLARQSFWLYKCQERVVNFGTAHPTGDSEEEKRVFLDRFPHLRGKRLMLFMGRIHPKKGCDLAIEAFAAVLANDPDWHLVFAGPDQVDWQRKLSSVAERLSINTRITWTGMLTDDLKWGAIRAAEVFLLPSHQENFGIVVAEALACGVPVLISNKVNIWREVQNEEAGFVAPDDFHGTCALMTAWIDLSAEQKAIMRDRARHCFQQKFEIQSASQSLFSVLAEQTTPQ